jgi:hydrogenase maturation protein HypF
LSGHVQGVGFRPFVYRLATELELTGYVQNRVGQVDIVACGRPESLQQFQVDLIQRAPPLASPNITVCEAVDANGYDAFEIIDSASDADANIFVPADNFMCDDCRKELLDPNDRRYRYPFINCTQCGPRYTLIEALPYDRPNTSMASFELCDDCAQEYADPENRRFHAEPVACPVCGPQISRTIDEVIDELHDGKVVAVKGIGGYHLVCDARNELAVATLRQRKQRPDKPLAVMFASLASARDYTEPTTDEAALIASPGRPIVLVTARNDCALAANVAPGLAEIGAFLPYSPLHELLLADFGGPLVATSGNISGEPVLTSNDDAESRLAKVADGFLHHNRPIVRPADDPVYRRIANGLRPLRIGRGCAPLELELPLRQKEPVLAVGGHMKGTVALSWDDRVVVSPHIGEMDSPRSLAVFEQLVADLQSLYGVSAKRILCDAHPGYTTHRWAMQQTLPVQQVWHHEAHASAAAAEFGGEGTWLAFAWDGVGLGQDSTLWGGEALLGKPGSWKRVASLRTFRLPGGERAGREPWRSAAALHWECGRSWDQCPDDDGLAHAAWDNGINSPVSSAAGRLFDAASALICATRFTSFEAQGPMFLESLCSNARKPVGLPLTTDDSGVLRSDWEPLLDVIGDSDRDATERAEIFHSSCAQAILDQALALRDTSMIDAVVLCGGVFQNRVLSDQVVALLTKQGFDTRLPIRLPCNDAALSYGQAAHVAGA